MGQKSEEIKIHCSPEFKDQVQDEADQKGLTASSYARMKLRESLPQKVDA